MLTFFILIFYAALWLQGYQNRRLEYRAYVGVKGILFLTNKTNPAWGDVFIISSNSGRTLGREGKIRQVVEHRQAPPPDNTIINEPAQAGSRILYVPGLDIQHQLGVIGTNVADTLVQAQPTKPGPSPAITPVVPSLKLPESLTKGFGPGFYIYGVIEYPDIFEEPHWTKFCYFIAPGSSTPLQCPTFTDAN